MLPQFLWNFLKDIWCISFLFHKMHLHTREWCINTTTTVYMIDICLLFWCCSTWHQIAKCLQMKYLMIISVTYKICSYFIYIFKRKKTSFKHKKKCSNLFSCVCKSFIIYYMKHSTVATNNLIFSMLS